MANVGVSGIKLIDSDGDALDDANGNLNVNIAGDSRSGANDMNLFLSINEETDVAVQSGAGAVANGVPRVTLASDDPAVVALQLIDDAIHEDDGNFTLNSSKGIPMMAFQGTQSIDSGDVGVLRCTAGGYLKVDISAASSAVVTSSEVTLGSQTYSEASTTGSVIGVVRNDTLATLANTDNEIAPLQVNASGALYVEVASSALGKATQSSQGSTDTGVASLAVRKDVLTDLADGNTAYTPLQVNANGALYITHGMRAMVSEVNDDVGTSPEDLRVAGDIACRRVDMMASPSNTGYIWVGDASVANDGTGGGIRLAPGDFYSVDVNSVNDLHVAATVGGEDIMYTYHT